MTPRIGQTLRFRKTWAVIRKIHPFGTIDVETREGAWFRISGLSF